MDLIIPIAASVVIVALVVMLFIRKSEVEKSKHEYNLSSLIKGGDESVCCDLDALRDEFNKKKEKLSPVVYEIIKEFERNPNDFKVYKRRDGYIYFKNDKINILGLISMHYLFPKVVISGVKTTDSDSVALSDCYVKFKAKRAEDNTQKIIQAIKDKNK